MGYHGIITGRISGATNHPIKPRWIAGETRNYRTSWDRTREIWIRWLVWSLTSDTKHPPKNHGLVGDLDLFGTIVEVFHIRWMGLFLVVKHCFIFLWFWMGIKWQVMASVYIYIIYTRAKPENIVSIYIYILIVCNITCVWRLYFRLAHSMAPWMTSHFTQSWMPLAYLRGKTRSHWMEWITLVLKKLGFIQPVFMVSHSYTVASFQFYRYPITRIVLLKTA